jgi:signal transduction histidine kinase
MLSGLRRWWISPAGNVLSSLVWTGVGVGGTYGEAHPQNPADQNLGGHPVPHVPDAAFLLVALAGLALILRRSRPRAALVAVTAAVLAYTGLGYVNGAALLLPAVALYALSSQVPARHALAWGASTTAVLMAATGYFNPFHSVTGGGFDLIPALMAAGCLGGIAVASQRAYMASMATRADDEARRRVDEERLRIARELHDVVAHTLATINVQAGVAAHLLSGRTADPATEALATIRDASKQALAELRSILAVLRQAGEADPTQPTPGLGQLDTLLSGTRRTGLQVDLHIEGSPIMLPAAVDLAAYRIIQEALTNVIKHAGPATATVHIRYQTDTLVVEVTDTGQGAAAVGSGDGHGIIGMRERAVSVGGRLEAGPCPGGGFAVSARLPLSGSPALEPPPVTAETSA